MDPLPCPPLPPPPPSPPHKPSPLQILVTDVSSLPPSGRRSYTFVTFHLYPPAAASAADATGSSNSSGGAPAPAFAPVSASAPPSPSWSQEEVNALRDKLTVVRSVRTFGPYRVIRFQQPGEK